MMRQEAAAVAVPAAGLTVLANVKNDRYRLLCFHFDVAAQNLDDFDVLARAHENAQLVDFTPADWTALPAGGRFRRSSGNLAAVAAAGNGYLEMDIEGLAEIEIRVSAAVNNANVTPRWSLH